MKQRIYINSTDFIPKSEFLLVEPKELKKEETTSGGLIISVQSQGVVGDRPTSGVIIEAGDCIEGYEVGDTIIWPAQDGIDLEFDDGEFLLIRDKSILGKKR